MYFRNIMNIKDLIKIPNFYDTDPDFVPGVAVVAGEGIHFCY